MNPSNFIVLFPVGFASTSSLNPTEDELVVCFYIFVASQDCSTTIVVNDQVFSSVLLSGFIVFLLSIFAISMVKSQDGGVPDVFIGVVVARVV